MDYKDAQKIVGFCEGESPKGDFYATPREAHATIISRTRILAWFTTIYKENDRR